SVEIALFDMGAPAVNCVDYTLADVHPHHLDACRGEHCCSRQADVAETDHGQCLYIRRLQEGCSGGSFRSSTRLDVQCSAPIWVSDRRHQAPTRPSSQPSALRDRSSCTPRWLRSLHL